MHYPVSPNTPPNDLAHNESQPNSALFENFDRLLLLQHGGETVYFGDIGKDAAVR